MLASGQIHNLTTNELRLDPLNPRLPEDVQESDQLSLAKFIARAYEPLSVATSIAEHGYFPSEPLIAIPDGDTYTVVEGNRRLTALLGLVSPSTRAEFDSSRQWDEVAETAERLGNVPQHIPVLIVADRKLVAPIIGFRHIAGILPWEPFAKARFIASLIDDEHLDFGEVAGLVGERRGDVQNHYRNFAIIKQAKSEFSLDTANVEDNFGVFTAAMNQRQIRAFIAAPDPAQVQINAPPIPSAKKTELEELLVWIGGNSDDRGRVIGESRDLKFLAKVVTNEKGLESLRSQGDLKTALDVVNESSAVPRQRLINRLQVAKTGLQNAAEIVFEVETDAEIEALVSDCVDAAHLLRDNIES